VREWIGPLLKYVFYIAAAAFIFDRALASQAETRRLLLEQRRLRAEITQIRSENARCRGVRSALESDPFYVERMLRERYGYRRPGEGPSPSGSAPTTADGRSAMAPAALASSR